MKWSQYLVTLNIVSIKMNTPLVRNQTRQISCAHAVQNWSQDAPLRNATHWSHIPTRCAGAVIPQVLKIGLKSENINVFVTRDFFHTIKMAAFTKQSFIMWVSMSVQNGTMYFNFSTPKALGLRGRTIFQIFSTSAS